MEAWNTHVMPSVDKLEAVVRAAAPQDLVASYDLWLKENQHPLAKELPLMNPFHVFLIVLAYFASVFIGKAIMSNFNKFELKTFSKLHNLFLIILSAYMCIGAIRGAIENNFALWGNGITNAQVEVRRLCPPLFLPQNSSVHPPVFTTCRRFLVFVFGLQSPDTLLDSCRK
jgi:GNS1/SUR4 family